MNILIPTITLMAIVICLYESITGLQKNTFQCRSKRSIIILAEDLSKIFLQRFPI